MSDLLDYDALAHADVASSPFPHIVVKNFLPPGPRAQVFDDLPVDPRGGSFPPEALRMGATAKQLMKELEGPKLRASIAQKFGLDLDDAPSMLTARVHTRAKDGQIHRDSESKRVTALLYLNPDREEFSAQAGCLRLLRNANDLEDYEVEVPPTQGTLLVFPNTPESWHGHRQYVGPRYSVQLNYMTNDSKARSELRRHKLSAFIKRII